MNVNSLFEFPNENGKITENSTDLSCLGLGTFWEAATTSFLGESSGEVSSVFSSLPCDESTEFSLDFPSSTAGDSPSSRVVHSLSGSLHQQQW
jgi:hypothetical protein